MPLCGEQNYVDVMNILHSTYVMNITMSLITSHRSGEYILGYARNRSARDFQWVWTVCWSCWLELVGPLQQCFLGIFHKLFMYGGSYAPPIFNATTVSRLIQNCNFATDRKESPSDNVVRRTQCWSVISFSFKDGTRYPEIVHLLTALPERSWR